MVAAAGIVLAGGRSSRMGRSKAALGWDGATLLYRTAQLLAATVDGPVVVVGAPGRELPALPPGVGRVDDPVADRGPLQGIATGLGAVAAARELAFVVATDLPLLHAEFVRRVLALLAAADVDAVVPFAHGHPQPLAAGYRTALAGPATSLIGQGLRRPPDLFARCRVHRPDAAELLADPDLATADPDLESLRGVNTPDEFAQVRARSGWAGPGERPIVDGLKPQRHVEVDDAPPPASCPDHRTPGA